MKNALAPWRRLMLFSVQNRGHPFYTVQAAFDSVLEDFYKDSSVSVSEVENLMIKGEKKTSHKNKYQNYMMREITYGAYQRNVPLPESVDIEKAKATFKEGMLTIEMPKKVAALEQYKSSISSQPNVISRA